MKINFNLKEYVVLQMPLPDMSRYIFLGDYDRLEEAMQAAHRDRGQLVVRIPAEFRLPDGGLFEVDSDKMPKEPRIMPVQGGRN
jgi:hypothetical protein